MRRPLLLATLLSFACAMAALWPAASAPTTTIVCNYVHPDCLSNHWLLVWVAEQLTHGASILHNDRYYWPFGDAPWLAGNGSEGITFIPFYLIFGWPTGSNLYFVTVLTLNGLGCWALARALGASRLASMCAAPSGALFLYAVFEGGAGRFSQMSIFWLAFFLASWLEFLKKPGTGRALLSAGLLAASSLFYWYYGLFGVLGGALLLWTTPGAGLRGRLVPLWKPLLIFSSSYLLLIGPLVYVFWNYWSQIPGTAEDIFPHPEAVGDSTWPAIPFLVEGGRHAGRALPFTTCVLAVFGLRRDRQSLSVAALILLFVALMAGPLIPHGPYELLYGIARPLRRFWWPYRHVVMINLFLIGLGSLGLDRLLQRFSEKRRGIVAALLAFSVPLQLELQHAPWHAQFSDATTPHPFYQQLAELPGTILVEPPLSPQVASAQTPLLYQLFHHKTLLAGHALWVARVHPDGWDEFVSKNSFLREMQLLEEAKLDGTFHFEGKDLQDLVNQGVTLYTVNREYFPVVMEPLTRAYETVFTALFGEPVLKGVRVKAWDAQHWNGNTDVSFERFEWPKGLKRGGPTLSVQAPRPPSPVFSIPDGPGRP